MRKVTLFTRRRCQLCDEAMLIVERVAADIPVVLEIINIDDPANRVWLDQYDHHVPVILIDGKEHARHHVDEQAFEAALGR